MRNMAKGDVSTVSEKLETMDVLDLGEYLLQAIRERLGSMTDGELDALIAGLPGNSIGPGRMPPDLDRLAETLWYLHHVHQDVLDD